MQDDDAFDLPYASKYAEYIKAGLSRTYIENELEKDGCTQEDIITFWMAVAEQALNDAKQSDKNQSSIWQNLKKFQQFQLPGPLMSTDASNSSCNLRFVCISDTHGLHEDWNLSDFPKGDVLIHAGDFTDTGDRNEVIEFNAFLSKLPYKYKIVIAGNHESSFDASFYHRQWKNYGHEKEHDVNEVRSLLTNAVYLEDSSCIIQGIHIYGTPWQPKFSDWAFNLVRKDLCEKWKKIPENVDVLITHTPPLGRGDRICTANVNVGCVDLLYEIQKRIQPKMHVFGHVHEGYGVSCDGYTTFINASSCTEKYALSNPPIVFDLPLPDNAPVSDDARKYDMLLTAAVDRRRASMKQSVESCEDPSIAGSAADTLFEEILKSRPIVNGYNTRAMRYLFNEGTVQKMQLKERIRCITTSTGTSTGEKRKDSEPMNYAPVSPRGYNARLFTRRPPLRRRMTVSVLATEEDDEKECSDKTIPKRQALTRRSVVPRLPSFGEEDDDERDDDNAMEVDEKEIVEEECLLCTYKVNGHVHEGKKKEESSLVQELDMDMLVDADIEEKVPTIPGNGKAPAHVSSSWF